MTRLRPSYRWRALCVGKFELAFFTHFPPGRLLPSRRLQTLRGDTQEFYPGHRTSLMHWLLIGYMFLFIHRPFEFWTVLGDMHIERLYVVGVFLVWLVQPKRWCPN